MAYVYFYVPSTVKLRLQRKANVPGQSGALSVTQGSDHTGHGRCRQMTQDKHFYLGQPGRHATRMNLHRTELCLNEQTLQLLCRRDDPCGRTGRPGGRGAGAFVR